MNYTIRPIDVAEINQLEDFLYEAIFIPAGISKPSRDIIKDPDLQIYIKDFGGQAGDYALVAEVDNRIVGAAWSRIINDYGHIDDETPSLSISLYKEFRGKGIGTELMKGLLNLLKAKDFSRVSLSVQKANYAVKMYEKLGFKVFKEHADELVMFLVL